MNPQEESPNAEERAHLQRLLSRFVRAAHDEGDESEQSIGELSDRRLNDERQAEKWAAFRVTLTALSGLAVGIAALFQAVPFGGNAIALAAAVAGGGILATISLIAELAREFSTRDVQPLASNLQVLRDRLEEQREPLLHRSDPSIEDRELS